MTSTRFILVLSVLAGATAAFADGSTSGRLSSRDFDKAYPGEKVFATAAKASSAYGRGQSAEDAIGKPRVFPRFGDNRGTWACANKNSPSDWLEVEFPATQTETILIYETCDPGAIRQVLVDGTSVFQTSEKPGKFNRAQVLWIRLSSPRSVSKVRIELNPSLVPAWPEIDAVALVPPGGAPAPSATPTPAGKPAPTATPAPATPTRS